MNPTQPQPSPETPDPSSSDLSVTVVITCYTQDRWSTLVQGIEAVRGQTHPCEVVVVVDHAPDLLKRLHREGGAGLRILPNVQPRGASGGRNTGAAAATSELVVFLDDDQEPGPSWIAELVAAHQQFPEAVGFGGAIEARWPGRPPRWFPPAFSWVVGATTPGQPAGYVRNVWGGNTLVERATFLASGGYNTSFGKLGAVSEPEDTELCLRMTTLAGGARWRFVPSAVVVHHVPEERSTWSYFVRRCWLEGRGKRAMAALGRAGDLADEAAFARTVLARHLLRDVRAGLSGDAGAWFRAAAAVVGVLTAALAFVLPVPERAERQMSVGGDAAAGPGTAGEGSAVARVPRTGA
jgi:GT2 family glycosyltransferase